MLESYSGSEEETSQAGTGSARNYLLLSVPAGETLTLVQSRKRASPVSSFLLTPHHCLIDRAYLKGSWREVWKTQLRSPSLPAIHSRTKQSRNRGWEQPGKTLAKVLCARSCSRDWGQNCKQDRKYPALQELNSGGGGQTIQWQTPDKQGREARHKASVGFSAGSLEAEYEMRINIKVIY